MPKIYVEFQDVARTVPTAWTYNTFIDPHLLPTGQLSADLKDDTNTSTGISLHIDTAFSSSGGGSSFATANAGEFDESVLDSALQSANGSASRLRLAGLPSGASYTLHLAGHTSNVARDTLFTVEGTTAEYLVGSAATPTLPVEFTGAVDPDGELIIDVEKTATGEFYGYANGFILDYTVAASASITDIDGDNDVMPNQTTTVTGEGLGTISAITLGSKALTLLPIIPLTSFYIAPSLLGLDSREPQGENTNLPDISVSGATADRSTATITTSTLDFGPAPTVYLAYDGEQDTVGQLVNPQPTNGATVASITAGNLVVDDGAGASKSWYATQDAVSRRIDLFLPDITQCFVSFRYKNNNKWSGTAGWPNAIGEEFIVPADSTWKMSWIGTATGSDVGSHDTNLCLPTHPAAESLTVSGNSHNMSVNGLIHDLKRSAAWGEWATVETYIKAGTPVTADTGIGVFNMTSPNAKRKHVDFTGSVFNPAGTEQTFKRLHIPGWIDDYVGLSVQYSDVYVADTPSRVIVGDHPILSECRFTAVCPHTSWSSQSITAEIHVPHDKDTNLYLFVVDDSGSALSEIGTPLFGGNL